MGASKRRGQREIKWEEEDNQTGAEEEGDQYEEKRKLRRRGLERGLGEEWLEFQGWASAALRQVEADRCVFEVKTGLLPTELAFLMAQKMGEG